MIALHIPAIQAVMKHAMVPATNARNATLAKSDLLFGARTLKPPICTPIDPILANPHSAYVAIVSERN